MAIYTFLQTTKLLGNLLSLDNYLTGCVSVCALPSSSWQHALNACCKCLELSGHGVLWFALCGLLILFHLATDDPLYFAYSLNLLMILVLDIAVVAPMKLLFRRGRPPLNQGTIPMSVSNVDIYAFPSGHASRCVALAAYFCYVPPFLFRTHLWYIWAAVVSLSRILIGRHHFSDVCVGMIAGLVVFDITRRLGLLYSIPL